MYTVYDCLCTCTEYRYSGIIYTIHIYIYILDIIYMEYLQLYIIIFISYTIT